MSVVLVITSRLDTLTPTLRKLGWLLAVVCGCLSATAWANDNLRVVTAPEVKHMMENVPGTLVIHSLSEIEYRIQHISGSVSIPVTDMETTDKLPKDKNHNVVFYCMGDKCSYSERACHKATALGYSNVFWFRGGIPEWRRFNYPLDEDEELTQIQVDKLSPAEVDGLIQQPDVILLDVRPLWWKAIPGAIANSQFMPLVELQDGYANLPKDKRLVLVDGYMKQSPSAAKYLITKGYNVVGVLKGGIGRWEKEGFPIVPKDSQEP